LRFNRGKRKSATEELKRLEASKCTNRHPKNPATDAAANCSLSANTSTVVFRFFFGLTRREHVDERDGICYRL
jgi:hypothetical protein